MIKRLEGYRILKNSKYLISILILVFLGTLTPANSAVTAKGESCSEKKAEQIIKSKNSYLICKKTGTKYSWRLSTLKAYKNYRGKLAEVELAKLNAEAEAKQKARAEIDAEMQQAAKELEEAMAVRHYVEGQAQRDSMSKGPSYICIVGQYCSVGNVGPGGGIVFIGEGIAGNGKHYEIAPMDWQSSSGDPQLLYCNAKDGVKTIDGLVFNGINEPIFQYPGKPGFVYTNNRIGDGKNNTAIIIGRCKESAASKAASYLGGGYSDWFLPSVAELSAAYAVKEKIYDLQPKPYWSSSELLAGGKGKALIFDEFGEIQDLPIGAIALVRPVRNF